MSTISNTARGTNNLNIAIALTIALAAMLALAVATTVEGSKAPAIPVTGSLSAYVQYLQGEKMIYTSPNALNDALTAYHLGEKPLFDRDAALSLYRTGEKTVFVVNDLGSALWDYHLGEKGMVPFAIREAAWIQYIQGEKDLR